MLALLVLAVLRLALSAVLARTGLLAISDDDYARVALAERFAASPHVDPTQTSWLPFPIWCMGAVMRAFGSCLGTARVWTEILAVSAAWLLFAGGRRLGMSRRSALAGSALTVVLPSAAVLGSAPVPELPTAALCAFALMAVGRPQREVPSQDLWPALAVLAASLSRYEAWPIALIVAASLLLCRLSPAPDHQWSCQARRTIHTAIALAGPLLWLVHNRIAHDDALHFFRRVAAYRAALGGTGTAHADLLLYLPALATAAPILAASVVLLTVLPKGAPRFFISTLSAAPSLSRWRPALAGALALIVFLVAGAWFGGVPTHHAGRTLLLVWLLCAMAFADRLIGLAKSWARAWMALVVFASLLQFPKELADGLDRRSEVAIGQALRARVPVGQRVLVATDDYGYFAVTAAFGRPLDVAVDRTHDPRNTVESSSVITSDQTRQKLRDEGASWLVVPARISVEGLDPVIHNDKLSIFRQIPPP